ncbi:hypothetical protein ABIB06_005964 [Bradyrhizobium sp. LB8.2]|uniref:hypothetical protein n=1 Tax=unclassified Bradyrhizobium TaxID=2631580 RepID=UPI003391B18C
MMQIELACRDLAVATSDPVERAALLEIADNYARHPQISQYEKAASVSGRWDRELIDLLLMLPRSRRPVAALVRQTLFRRLHKV